MIVHTLSFFAFYRCFFSDGFHWEYLSFWAFLLSNRRDGASLSVLPSIWRGLSFTVLRCPASGPTYQSATICCLLIIPSVIAHLIILR